MGLPVATYSIVEGNVAPAMERWVWLTTRSGMQRARRAARLAARVGHRAASAVVLVLVLVDPGNGRGTAHGRSVPVADCLEGGLGCLRYQPGPRSAAVSAYPGATVIRPGSLPHRAVAGTADLPFNKFAEGRRPGSMRCWRRLWRCISVRCRPVPWLRYWLHAQAAGFTGVGWAQDAQGPAYSETVT